jgi:hypothetical protein
VSLGAITAIIGDERGKAPDIDALRNLNVALRESGTTLPDAMRGGALLGRLNELDVDVSQLTSCVRLLSRYGASVKQVLEAAQGLMALEASIGMTYEQIVADAVAKEQMRRRLQEGIAGLERRERAAADSLRDVEGLKAIATKLRGHNITLDRLGSFIEWGKRLGTLGFTPAAAESLASELARIGMDPSRASAVLATMLAKYEGLEGAVAEEQRLGQVIKMGRAEVGNLSSQIDALRRQAEEQRELTLKAERQLQDEYAIKRRGLQVEISELERRRDALATEVREYRTGLQELRSQGEEYHEELNLAKVILGVKMDPSGLKHLRLDYTVLMVSAALGLIRAKGIGGLKVPLKSVADVQYQYLGYHSEVGLGDMLELTLKTLRSLSQVT